jgi:hypothetical protein
VRAPNEPGRATERRARRRITPASLLLVAGLLPAVVVYGVNWRRGHYLDDARYDALSPRELFEIVGVQRTRPLGNILTGATYVIGEPAGRIVSALVLGAAAALAGLLVWRTCRAQLGSVVAALLIVYPALDFESALFWYAAILYPAGAAFGLAGAHCFLSMLRAPDRRSALVNGIACAALFAGGVACTEVAINFLVLVPGLYLVERFGRRVRDHRATRRSLATGGVTVAAVGALGAFLFLPDNEFTSSRGELILNPLDATRRVFDVWLPQLQDLAYSRTRLRIHAEAFDLGAQDLSRPIALVVFGAAIVLGALAIAATARLQPAPGASEDRRSALVLAATAVVLFMTASVIPAALLSEQSPVTRLLFASWIGLALLVGSGVALVERWPRPHRMALASVAVATMAAVLVLAVTLNGYGELFRRRDARDEAQVAAWAAVLATADPVPGDVRGVNFYGSDQLLDEPSPLDNTFVGITELPWVMSLKLGEYRGGNAVGVPGGHPSVPVCMELTADPEVLHVTSNFIDEYTPISSILPAEMYEDQLVIIDEIRFGSRVIRFPLAERVPPERYEHVQLETDGDRFCRAFGQTVS